MRPGAELVTRREITRGFIGVGMGSLAGCLFEEDPVPDYQLSVNNATQQPISVSITLTYIDENSVVLDDSYTLEGTESREYTDIMGEQGDYRMEIVVDEDRTQTAEWGVPKDTERFHRIIDITDDQIAIISSAG